MLTLERFAYTPMGTFGRIRLGDRTIYTVERPWLNNQPHVSCIPVGVYSLEPHNSSKYPHTWALVGDSVSHYPERGKRRNLILFHAGNTMHDVEGCIAPGEALGYVKGMWGVYRSRDAMHTLRKWIQDLEVELFHIVNYVGGVEEDGE